jgi:sialate O-acetylesterase
MCAVRLLHTVFLGGDLWHLGRPMILPRFARAVFLPALLLITLTAAAEVRLPKLWSDHAVIQRDRPIHVWGWADAGRHVTATLQQANGGAEETGSAVTDSLGHWSVYLAPRPAGGAAYTLTVSEDRPMGGGSLLVFDLLMGDVWLASGQSNMELPLLGFPGSAVLKNGPEEIKAANHPEIRLLHEAKRFSPFPLQDQDAMWQICTPETAATFSAVAYFFAREIQHDQKVPIGLVESDWGGTPAESWTSLDTLGNDAALMPVFAERAADMDKQADAEVIKARYAREDAEAKAAGRKPEEHPWQPPVEPWAASSLYNGMIAPVTPLAIRGVIWYQGEANSSLARAPLYHRLFSSMIGDWRRQFAQGDFPFPVCTDLELRRFAGGRLGHGARCTAADTLSCEYRDGGDAGCGRCEQRASGGQADGGTSAGAGCARGELWGGCTAQRTALQAGDDRRRRNARVLYRSRRQTCGAGWNARRI